MNDLLPSLKCWITSAIAISIVAALPSVVAYLQGTSDAVPERVAQQDARANDTMLEIARVATPAPKPPSEQATTSVEQEQSVSRTPPAPTETVTHASSSVMPPPEPDLANATSRIDSTVLQQTAPQHSLDAVSLERELPAAQAAEYKELRNEGIALQASTDGRVPGYEAEIPPDLIDTWLNRGLARLVVIVRHERNAADGIYAFAGTLSDPGRYQLIERAAEVRGFSTRNINLSYHQGQSLLRRVPVSRSGTMEVTPGILIRADLDAVVLAVQMRVARELNLPLEQIAMTYGRFQVVNGLPFTYGIDRVLTVDGQTLRVPASSVDGAQG